MSIALAGNALHVLPLGELIQQILIGALHDDRVADPHRLVRDAARGQQLNEAALRLGRDGALLVVDGLGALGAWKRLFLPHS